MQFTTLSLLALLAPVFAVPTGGGHHEEAQTVHLKFHGGPASYDMVFPADGKLRYTNNELSINIIDAPDYFALSHCEFVTDGEKALVGGFSPEAVQQVIVGPPQPIRAVKCSGKCLATYQDCYVNGQFVGECCAGFCAANKCRPWRPFT